MHNDRLDDIFGDDLVAAGHAYTEENTYRWRNERHCRACHTETKRLYNARQRGF
jgi:hypothetical protein